MPVQLSYRLKYTCDLESELSLDWGEGAIAYCKENGGKWWKIESGAWVEKTAENPTGGGGADWADITNKPATFAPSAHNHDASYEPINANIQAHVGSSHAPSDAQKNSDITKAEIEAKLTGAITSHTHASSGGLGYAIPLQALTSSPADGATIYFGTLPKAPVTAAGTSKVYIRKAGTIRIAEIYCYSGTAGSNQNWSLYVRLNNTTDTLIATLGVSASERVFSKTDLAIAVVVGDYIEIKAVNPTWTTNPLTTIFGGHIYID